MSKLTVLAALNKLKQRLQSQKAQLDTEITNLQTQLDAKKAARVTVVSDLSQVNLDLIEVQNSNLA